MLQAPLICLARSAGLPSRAAAPYGLDTVLDEGTAANAFNKEGMRLGFIAKTSDSRS